MEGREARRKVSFWPRQVPRGAPNHGVLPGGVAERPGWSGAEPQGPFSAALAQRTQMNPVAVALLALAPKSQENRAGVGPYHPASGHPWRGKFPVPRGHESVSPQHCRGPRDTAPNLGILMSVVAGGGLHDRTGPEAQAFFNFVLFNSNHPLALLHADSSDKHTADIIPRLFPPSRS